MHPLLHSTTGGRGSEALVYFGPDVVSSNGRGEATPKETYLKASPAQQQAVSATWSKNLRLPYILLGRPGTYGSSGEHAKRRTPREIAVVSSALDAIKARHGYERLHLIGHTEGGHTAAALLPLRTDVGCVVLASALVSVRAYLAELGTDKDFTGNKNPLDPIASVDRIARGADLRIFILTDPDDAIVSARSQTAYAKRLIAGGLPARQIFAAASDLSAHALFRQAHQVAAACANGVERSAHIPQPPRPGGCSDEPISGRGLFRRHTSRSDGLVPMDRPAIIAIARARSRCGSRRRRSTR
jgi:hypothetical protein